MAGSLSAGARVGPATSGKGAHEANISAVIAFDRFIASTLPFVPRGVVRWVADPYIAGETDRDALRTVLALNRAGMLGTLDLLGEELTELKECRAIARRYRELLALLDRSGADSGVSVKLSALGLRLDPAVARDLIRDIVAAAREVGRFVRIDMEDASTTDATLAIYRILRGEGFDNVGVVLQACLKRTYRDACELARMGASVRVVKGIYVERERISWRDPEIVRDNFVRIVRVLLEGGGRVASATHDERLVYQTTAVMEALSMDPREVEFQMLLGVREGLRDDLVANGRRVRIYVPFGEQWYAYSVRRLRENPAVAGHVTRQLLGRVLRRK